MTYREAIAQLVEQQNALDRYSMESFEATLQHFRELNSFVAVRARFVQDKVMDAALELSVRLRSAELAMEEREWAADMISKDQGLAAIRTRLLIGVDTGTRWSGKAGPAPHPDELFCRYYDLDHFEHPAAPTLALLENGFNASSLRIAIHRAYGGATRITLDASGIATVD